MTNQIANIEMLVSLRLAGKRPALQFVFWNTGCRLSGCEAGILEDADVERLDLRPFVDLDVLVIADRYSPALVRFCERLNEYAATTSLTVLAWLPDDLGLVWEKGAIQPRPFGPGPVRQEVAA